MTATISFIGYREPKHTTEPLLCETFSELSADAQIYLLELLDPIAEIDAGTACYLIDRAETLRKNGTPEADVLADALKSAQQFAQLTKTA